MAQSSVSSRRGNNGRAAGKLVGVGQVQAGGGGGRRAGRRPAGLARGTGPRAEASSPGKTEVGSGWDPGGGGGGAVAHPAGNPRVRRPGVGSLFPRPWPRSSVAIQVGARRGAHVGRRAAGLARQAGSRGSAPSPLLLPRATRLLPTRGSGGSGAPPAFRGCLGGRDRLLLLLGGAGRGGAEGGRPSVGGGRGGG